MVLDLDGVLVIAHSDKQEAHDLKEGLRPPLMGFVDHGRDGTGEPVAGLLWPGNAGSNTASDHTLSARAADTHPLRFRRWHPPSS